MSLLQALLDQIPRLVARETLRVADAVALGSGKLSARDARDTLRGLQRAAGFDPYRQPGADPVALALRLGVQVVRE